MPYLADTKLAVSFTNIRINTDYQLIEGVVSTTYDATWGDVESADEEVEDMEDLIDDIFGDEAEDGTTDNGSTNDDTTTEEDTDSSTEETNAGENTNTNTNDTDNSNTDTSNNSSSDSSTTNTTDTTNSNSGTNTTTDTNAIENGSTDTNNTTSSTTEKEVVIEHNGKSYKNKDIIEVPYSREETNFAFLLKNYPKGAKINWQVLKLGTDNTSIFATNETIHDNFGINMKEIHILDVVANYNDEKIRVTIKRVLENYQLTSIKVYEDAKPKRKAYFGETLYLVRNKLMTEENLFKFNAVFSPDVEQNKLYGVSWYHDGKLVGFKNKKSSFKWLSTRTGDFSVAVNGGNSETLRKEAHIKWVSIDQKQFNFIPTNIYNSLVNHYGSLEQLFGAFNKYDIGIPVKIDPIKIGGTQFNEEVKRSRLYKHIQRGYVNGGVSVDFENFLTVPALKLLERANVVKVGISLKFKAGVKLEGGVERYKIIENDFYEDNNPYIKFNPYGCVGLELGAELLVARDLLEIDIGGDVTSCIGGIIQYKFGTDKFDGYVYLDPLILSGWVKIKTKGLLDFELIDWKDSIRITEKITTQE
ncbi:hypothetical protein [Tenacibaculum maritimum]|uniref:hypothetical protein n=1 Tax=Tenacibaculum maritimum TaxID=107401 RepID=UPI001330EAEB|nr:hypothetical protein [Tenacibaculum maritimum]